jgi:hypothetical protein
VVIDKHRRPVCTQLFARHVVVINVRPEALIVNRRAAHPGTISDRNRGIWRTRRASWVDELERRNYLL